MRLRLARAAMAVALLVLALACAAQGKSGAMPPQQEKAPGWAFSATGYYYSPRNQGDYLSVIATAERGPLLLETRYNYEALDTGSLFAGWKFSGGEALTYELTPILGVVFGQTQGVAPGFKASLAYGIVDYYVEAEYLRDSKVHEDSFTYAWTELGFSPAKWLRFGLVGQRTRVYHTDRDFQRGPFAQLIAGKVTLGAYVFNPDGSANRVAIVSLGAQF
jgi:hypothetical protein